MVHFLCKPALLLRVAAEAILRWLEKEMQARRWSGGFSSLASLNEIHLLGMYRIWQDSCRPDGQLLRQAFKMYNHNGAVIGTKH